MDLLAEYTGGRRTIWHTFSPSVLDLLAIHIAQLVLHGRSKAIRKLVRISVNVTDDFGLS